MYANFQYPRKLVQEVIEYKIDFVNNLLLPSLKFNIIDIITENNDKEAMIRKVEECFQRHGTIFDTVDTDAKRFQLLKSRGYIDYEKILLGERLEETLVNNASVLKLKYYGIFVPLRETIKIFLEVPGVFKELIQYMKMLNEEKKLYIIFYRPNCGQQSMPKILLIILYCQYTCTSMI